MGQCLPAQAEQTIFHPLLGTLQTFVSKGERYSSLKMMISSEEQYMSWSKNINKLKYNNEINKIIYLPVRECFNHSQGFCETNHQITLTFKAYHQTLKDNINNNLGFNRRYQQTQIWYFISTLTKYLRYFDRNFQNCINLTYNHILIDRQGKLKVIPQIIMPNFHRFEVNSQDSWNQPDKTINLIYVIGIITLSLTSLIPLNTFYDDSKRKWKPISQEAKIKYLFDCRQKYSQNLTNMVKQLLEANNSKRISNLQLFNKFQLIQSLEIHQDKFFGDSREETTRDKYADLGSIKNSNLFLSEGTNKLWQSQIRFEQNKNDKQQVHQTQYPSIL